MYVTFQFEQRCKERRRGVMKMRIMKMAVKCVENIIWICIVNLVERSQNNSGTIFFSSRRFDLY